MEAYAGDGPSDSILSGALAMIGGDDVEESVVEKHEIEENGPPAPIVPLTPPAPKQEPTSWLVSLAVVGSCCCLHIPGGQYWTSI